MISLQFIELFIDADAGKRHHHLVSFVTRFDLICPCCSGWIVYAVEKHHLQIWSVGLFGTLPTMLVSAAGSQTIMLSGFRAYSEATGCGIRKGSAAY